MLNNRQQEVNNLENKADGLETELVMKDVLYNFKIQIDLEENKVLLFNFEANIIFIIEATFITSMTHSVLQPAIISTL